MSNQKKPTRRKRPAQHARQAQTNRAERNTVRTAPTPRTAQVHTANMNNIPTASAPHDAHGATPNSNGQRFTAGAGGKVPRNRQGAKAPRNASTATTARSDVAFPNSHESQPHGLEGQPYTYPRMYSINTKSYHRRWPYVIGAIVAIVVIALVIVFAIIPALSAVTEAGKQAVEQLETQDANTASDTAASSTTITLSFAGDCTLGTDENFNYSTSFNAAFEEHDAAWFFENVADIFNDDDLTVVNMEGTLTQSTSRQDKTYAFKGSAEYVNVLVEGGVEAASMANNHSQDYGSESYTDTVTTLEDAGISTFGYDSIAYEEVNGATVALIGTYELATGLAIQDELEENIALAEDEGADVIVVYFHWGEEKETVPDEIQVQLGHAAIDAGADLVVGSHPHVIQGYEKYNGRYIVYSLGNFCFGGNSNPADKDCMIFQQTFTINAGEVETDDDIEVIPCSVSSSSSSNNYQPTPATGDEKTRIEEKIEESNDAIAELSASLSS